MNMRRWLVVGLVFGSTCIASGAPAVRALAEDTAGSSQNEVGRAEGFAADAFNAYARKEYAAAVTLYLKAWDAAPSADILYNLARIYDGKLKDRQLAIDYYRRYVRDPGAEPLRLRAANERLSQLLELEAISGERSVAQRPDVVTLSAPASRDHRARTDSKVPESGSGLTSTHVLGIVALTAGVTGLGIGAGFGLAARSDAAVADDNCDGNACRNQRGVDAARNASSAATISTIAFAAGGVLSALGVATLLLASPRDDRERNTARLSWTPLAGPSLIGTRIAGRW